MDTTTINFNKGFGYCLVAFAILTSSSQLVAQAPTCCDQSGHTDFVAFASDSDFVTSHLEPVSLDTFEETGKSINYSIQGDEDGSAYYLAAKEKSNKWLFVIHEWWGLNDHIKNQAQALQDSLGNVNVLCLDLYDGKSATTRDEASALMAGAEEKRIRALIDGALSYAGTNAKIATIGWCFGGGWSMQTALMAGAQANACVIYYGMPESDLEKIKSLNADVLGVFATHDKWINPDVVKEFEAKMTKAHKNLQAVSFDAEHAFANPSNPQYLEDATAQAMRLTLAFIKDRW